MILRQVYCHRSPALPTHMNSNSNRSTYQLLNKRFITEYKSQIFLKIHPDLFANESAEVKKANLTCMQDLNLLFETYESIQSLITTSTQPQVTLLAKQKFPSIYELSCFTRQGPDRQLGLVSYTLLIPDTLDSTKHTTCAHSKLNRLTAQFSSQSDDPNIVSKSVLVTSLKLLSHDFLRYVEILDIPLSAEARSRIDDSRPDTSTDPSAASSSSSSSFTGPGLDASLNDLMCERLIIRQHLARQRIRSSIYRNHRDKDYRAARIRGEVEQYLRSDHLFMRGLSLEGELEATGKLREFLVSYGDVLNFSVEAWSSLVIVIYDNADIHQSQSSFSVKGKGGKVQGRGRQPETRTDLATREVPYRCTVTSGVHVVEVPHTFKKKALIRFLHEHAPQTQISSVGMSDELHGV